MGAYPSSSNAAIQVPADGSSYCVVWSEIIDRRLTDEKSGEICAVAALEGDGCPGVTRRLGKSKNKEKKGDCNFVGKVYAKPRSGSEKLYLFDSDGKKDQDPELVTEVIIAETNVNFDESGVIKTENSDAGAFLFDDDDEGDKDSDGSFLFAEKVVFFFKPANDGFDADDNSVDFILAAGIFGTSSNLPIGDD